MTPALGGYSVAPIEGAALYHAVHGLFIYHARVFGRDICPPELTKQMIRKGSITIDGVSLTLVDVEPGRFSVALIPHTLAITTLGFKQAGATVNLETDLFAKYVFK